MKTRSLVTLFNLLLVVLIVTGCRRNSNTVWEDTKTAGRHVNRGVRSLGGKNSNSRQIYSRDEFMYADAQEGDAGYGGDFIALSDDPNNNNQVAMGEMVTPPPRETPGDPGSTIPGIAAFRDPNTNPAWAQIFRNITFAYNSSLVKGEDNLNTVRNIADYMRRNPNVYIFVEGHCDERGPEAYNLALGSHRANAVRNLLVGEGISADNVFTISYGKERPLVFGQGEESWEQNRRAEFKIYSR